MVEMFTVPPFDRARLPLIDVTNLVAVYTLHSKATVLRFGLLTGHRAGPMNLMFHEERLKTVTSVRKAVLETYFVTDVRR